MRKSSLLLSLILLPYSVSQAALGDDINRILTDFFGSGQTPEEAQTQVPELDIPEVELVENPDDEDLALIREEIFLEEAAIEELEVEIRKRELELWEVNRTWSSVENQLFLLDSQIGINQEKVDNYAEQEKEWKADLEKLSRQRSEMKARIRVAQREYEKDQQRAFVRNEHFGSGDSVSVLKWLFSDRTVAEILEEQRQERFRTLSQQEDLTSLKSLNEGLEASEKQTAILFARLNKLKTQILREKANLGAFAQARARLLDRTLEDKASLESALARDRASRTQSSIYLQNLRQSLKETQTAIENGEKVVVVDEDPEALFVSPLPFELKVTAQFRDAAYLEEFGIAHDGVDFFAPQSSELLAIADGVVEKIGENQYGYSFIILKHAHGFYSVYGHISEALVSEGDSVVQGENIALSGGTPGTKGAGYFTTGPHLHLELFKDGNYVNPLHYLPIK